MTDVTSPESILVLEDLQAEHAGEYRCRANNDFSAVYSEKVSMDVKGTRELLLRHVQ